MSDFNNKATPSKAIKASAHHHQLPACYAIARSSLLRGSPPKPPV